MYNFPDEDFCLSNGANCLKSVDKVWILFK